MEDILPIRNQGILSNFSYINFLVRDIFVKKGISLKQKSIRKRKQLPRQCFSSLALKQKKAQGPGDLHSSPAWLVVYDLGEFLPL